MYKSVHLEIYFHLNIDVGKWEFFSSFFLKFPTEADNSANFKSLSNVFCLENFFFIQNKIFGHFWNQFLLQDMQRWKIEFQKYFF